MVIDNVFDKLKEFSQIYDIRNKDDLNYFTASEIAAALGIKRTAASHFLNRLNEEGKAVKINTRPVYFIDGEILAQKYNIDTSKDSFDSLEELFAIQKRSSNYSFSKLIGYNGSLRHQIEQCKSAVDYPPEGLPLLFNGPTGTGKSYMAQLVYEYAKEAGVIDADAPFNIFNCADYANNSELLSANLFGYVKGAFTGAEKDTPGIIEKSDGGFLFLDEVHRLNAEGQEKLFVLMDKGGYTRIGESGTWRTSKVRLIFATTENIEETLIETFLRRIPIIVNISDLNHRGEAERLEFIYSFFYTEASNIHKNIKLSNKVMLLLMKHTFKGNIGELRNIIKYTCANAYSEQGKQDEALVINLKSLPDEVIEDISPDEVIQSGIAKSIVIDPEQPLKELYHKKDEINEYFADTFDDLYEINVRCKNGEMDLNNYVLQSTKLIDDYFDKILFYSKDKMENNIRFDITKNILSNILDFMSRNYGLKFYGNTTMVLSYYLNNRFYGDNANSNLSGKILDDYVEFIKDNFSQEYNYAHKLVEMIESSFDTKCTNEDIIIFTFYLSISRNDFGKNKIRAVIVAHGYSTASSIANVANRLLEQNIFEAFDMPIDMPTKDIILKLEEYIASIDTSNGLIILVDMGSLEEIYSNLASKTKGVIGVINNITTQLALDVGNNIQNGMDIKTITEKAAENNTSRYKIIFPELKKNKAIITTCMTGIGTAIKIKELLDESFNEDIDLDVIACDYVRLKNNGVSDELFEKYDVIAIVGTADPGIENVDYIALEDIITGTGEEELYNVFSKIIDDDTIKKLNMNIIKVFSLQRVLNTLTILNPDKMINYIEDAVGVLQEELDIQFGNDLIICLYIHMSCLIERLVTKTPIESYDKLEEFKQCHKDFINIVKKSFSVIENVYSVNMIPSEIGFIYDIIVLKIGDIKY